MANVERTYNIPLRKEWLKVPRYKRTNKAVLALRQFLIRHMKSEDVRLGKFLNKKMWEHGIQNPPHHVKVNVIKDEKGIVKAELFGSPVEQKKEKKAKKPEAKETKPEAAEIKAEGTEAKAEEKPETGKKEAKKPKADVPHSQLSAKRAKSASEMRGNVSNRNFNSA